MSGKRNVSVCIGHELANALYIYINMYMHVHIRTYRLIGVVTILKTYQDRLGFGKSFEYLQSRDAASKFKNYS